jgi:hypothetical protein
MAKRRAKERALNVFHFAFHICYTEENEIAQRRQSMTGSNPKKNSGISHTEEQLKNPSQSHPKYGINKDDFIGLALLEGF